MWVNKTSEFSKNSEVLFTNLVQFYFQVLCHRLDFCCLHFHFIAERVTLQLKPARGRDHARIIGDRLARKMDAKHDIHRFNRTDQHFTAVDQFLFTAFKNK